MLTGTKKLFGNDYKDFCLELDMAAEEDALPMHLRLENTFGLTFQDVSDLCRDVKKDTGLTVSAHLYMCDECNMLHMTLDIDYPEEEMEDEDIGYLQ